MQTEIVALIKLKYNIISFDGKLVDILAKTFVNNVSIYIHAYNYKSVVSYIKLDSAEALRRLWKFIGHSVHTTNANTNVSTC